jgi:alanyl-tRNA synthetase
MDTTRLYYTDSYLTAFETRVVDRADDGRRIYLEQTAFYPTSGGQPHDLGTLAATAVDRERGIDVVDVIDEGARIAHVLAAPLVAEASSVRGRIDWPRRLDHMQQHTGQHLLSAVLHDLFGYHTVSVHFGNDYSSLDVDAETVNRERLLEAEVRANAIVVENRPVNVSFEEAQQAAGLRKESAREGTLRIVAIEGLDRSACGGTHVRTTGEIGSILVRKVDKVRKSARIEFVCGSRGVRRARADFEALSKVASVLSTSIDDAPALVAAQGEQLRVMEGERRKLEREVAAFRARELYQSTAPDAGGIRRAVIRRESGGLDELRTLAQAFVALPKSLFAGALASPPSLVLAASEDSGIDAGRALRDALSGAGGKGGGSPRIAQGSVPDVDRLDAVLETMRRGG